MKTGIGENQVLADRVRSYIEEHYMEDICLQRMRSLRCIIRCIFLLIFQNKISDKNFIMYLSELRIEKAKELLADVTINVKDISRSVGYRDSSYFNKSV